METVRAESESGKTAADDWRAPFQASAISLPKGGGAIRGIGEKFAANPVTGTGSMSVPIATSPGRSGFGPQLSLSYDSGAGNGPFGFGWSLSLPSITRKTDKGLPQYFDTQDSDVFILSGVEDLVPVFKKKANGNWDLDADGSHKINEVTRNGYRIRRYRPRIEGLFARIERWTLVADPQDVHWRSFSKDNILTLYGSDADSRVVDPEDSSRTFSWLICETRDDKGNAMLYRYRAEDGLKVDLTQANERNRGLRDDKRRRSNRYVKHIYYGNRKPLLDNVGRRPQSLDKAKVDELITNAGWMFEVVFDYGEHDALTPKPNDAAAWNYRFDPFSTYRSGFEVRTTRRCKRVLMFHHFDSEEGVGKDCLVRSTDFAYSKQSTRESARSPIYSFLQAVTQKGYRRNNGGYERRSLPPVKFKYTQPIVQDAVHDVDPTSLENLPIGVDGTAYQWTDLHGEGIPGILSEQADAWFYKRNLSPRSKQAVEFAPLERVVTKPNLTLTGGRAQFMDLAGDGQPDLVMLDGPMPGLYEHDDAESWQPFQPFTSRLNRDTHDPNLKLIDLDGDGHADALITEDTAFVWHESLAEAGFGPARRVAQALDEEKGPRLVFADGTESIYLADLSGDGLTDLVRIRNGAVCYWPNLGYCRFGAKVTMDHAPHFDNPDQFDHKRIRLADIDGSGTTDIIYLHRDGVRLYFNHSGNSWSAPKALRFFPRVDDIVSIGATDLLGNGTACLVWSSPLPGDTRRQMRYVDLMGGQKPHLLVKTSNNLGAETHVHYASSTKFYLQDKHDGKPWITRLPFPVHVVERVETFDHISRNHFVTRNAYHHGYFDGEEREFRGFAMVEQWDTEQYAALSSSAALGLSYNVAAESHVPPVHTKTWFHTGVYLGRDHVSDFFAGLLNTADLGEYFREPGLTVLPDSKLPPDLSLFEEREACRSLKGAMLRREVYALDSSDKELLPYTVIEQNFTIERLQPREHNRHAVFFTHAREAINYHYERNPTDPRTQHALTLEVDAFGNVLREAAIGYGRRVSDASLPTDQDRQKQTRSLVTYTENRVAQDPVTVVIDTDYDYRVPLPCETRTYELTGFKPDNNAVRFSFDEWIRNGFALPASATEVPYELAVNSVSKRKRLVEQVRTLYRKNDLTALLPLGTLESLALPGESYKLAFTPGLLDLVFRRPSAGQPSEVLLPIPGAVLGGQAGDSGGYMQSQVLKADGRFPNTDANGHWWIPSGRSFFSVNPTDSAAVELTRAQQDFFVSRRYRDPFGEKTIVDFDIDNLLVVETRDALDNRVTVEANDYRVLQPRLVSDPNRNQTAVSFDALGMVVGTAVMGKPLPAPPQGDSQGGFVADLIQSEIDAFHDAADPHAMASALLQNATTRIVYDLDHFRRTQRANRQDRTKWLPAYAATLARETHASDQVPSQDLKTQISFSYSDGFGREIQKKIQAEPGSIVKNGPDINPRWVGSGWTIFNNKGKPVRQYEPFFSLTHRFEFGVKVGVSPILFYDPVERVIATIHPNHTYEKVVFDPWRQDTSDVNDTVLGDPRTDVDIKGYTAAYFSSLAAGPPTPKWQTWNAQRQGGLLGSKEQSAAAKAAAHADTSTTVHFDTLGRPFLTLADNGPDPAQPGQHLLFATRVELDIEGNQRAVRDANKKARDAQGNDIEDELGRIVMRYSYDMLGNRIHQFSMEAGERWMLNDVAGKPIRAWDSRGHEFRTDYDPLRRPLRSFVTGANPVNLNQKLLTERLVYGEQHPDAGRNLRGKLYLHLDQAGAVTSEAHDFKGNPLRASRRIAMEYKQALNWSTVDAALPANATAQLNSAALEGALAPLLEADTYTSRTTYDALNRPVTLTTPHTTTMQPSVIRPSYNEANLLERVDVNLRGAQQNGLPVWTAFVTDIDYDAKGQRTLIEYGNGARTTYEYDPLTFRLVHLLTQRSAVAFPGDCPQRPPLGWPGCQVQNLNYSYDPAGNITSIRDNAQQTIYFKNKRVEPSAEYTYDPLYRLIEATGREHLGQGGALLSHSHSDAGRVGVLSADAAGRFSPNDGNAMGAYVERYVYDAVGNFLEMQHRGTNPANAGWRRSYTYREVSLIEPTKHSNRLSKAPLQSDPPPTPRQFEYDAHGNMTRMPDLPLMHWDYRDQLQATAQQIVNNGIPETTYYVYDADGQRVRKITERLVTAVGVANGNKSMRKDERLYLGGFEMYREFKSDGVTIDLERATLHIMDDKQRICLVETSTTVQLIRYQFSNHLGSASLELDDQAQIISYEEYAPYGSTTYQAVRSQTETAKRYRYTGKERDEESGLYYHGARYYAPWLARWLSCDPIGAVDGLNLYSAFGLNPARLVDGTGTQAAVPTNQPYDGPTISAAPPFYGAPVPHKPELNPPHPEDAIGELAMTILRLTPAGPLLGALLGNLQIEHQLEHHEIHPEDAELARMQLVLGFRPPLPTGAAPPTAPGPASPTNASPAPAPTAPAPPPAQPLASAPRPGPPSHADPGGQPAPFRVGNAGETMAKFSMKNSAVSGPQTLLDQKATLKDASGKTALPDPNSTKGARLPDIPMRGQGGAVGTVEVKTPFGSPPLDPVEYLRTHPRAVNQLEREGRIISQGGTTWGPAGGQQWPVQAGEGIGVSTGYWVWKPDRLWRN